MRQRIYLSSPINNIWLTESPQDDESLWNPKKTYSSKCLLYKPNQFFTANNKSLRQKWLLKQRQFAQYCVMTEEFYRFGEEKRRKKEKKKKKKETKEEIYLFY
ncbi:hypothetical protein RO3G_11914 [Rhizopus delemar RA 99-880]|uniref:Uncharacterized protein n=1 Tax=Rhizopus delemar (strain RA 99-880 / ATCC MYA-4621 / FGSC 9543 / NRRL 43880) TaxID=246409 RepID=I1CFH3_RHIO9|nr:hypothetical protein RO3G_11914 [Rhizopus delemar RA 99-880]|eukprot:EIE87203.1 hypothetical protein RO3G_11914 [Rhizopus delemar RA 99-880]